MRRFSAAAGPAGCLFGLVLAVSLPGGCSSSADEAGQLAASGNRGDGGRAGAGASNGAAGTGEAARAGASATAGGEGNAGEATAGGGDANGTAGAAGNGAASAGDKCSTDRDCVQAAGSCFVCEAAGPAKDCIDKGPPRCDNAELEPCEVCELGQLASCVELGEPGEFSGGTARCLATCDGWDTSGCSICGNERREPGEDCDGPEPAEPRTCADEGLPDNPATVLPCTEQCRFDTTLCGGCSKDAVACLNGGDCAAPDCDGAECKAGTTCEFDCRGEDTRCHDVRCNHGASCHFACSDGGACDGVVCDGGSSCELDCEGGACDDVACRPGADCDLRCVGAGCSGEARCDAGDTCQFDCSAGGDCRGLQVECRSGSTCTFVCTGEGSVCPKADCQEQSSCTFQCTDGDCNEPSCADGACSGN